MPSTALPRPVLAVTHDAVRNLHGREAVSSLWILFTKCKESLHDGRRLENIAWRLWYRALSQDEDQQALPSQEEEEEVFDEKKFDEKEDEDELVEKRARDRDYGRTGSWQEREKDRLAVGLDTLVGGVLRGAGIEKKVSDTTTNSNSDSDRATSGPAPTLPLPSLPTGKKGDAISMTQPAKEVPKPSTTSSAPALDVVTTEATSTPAAEVNVNGVVTPKLSFATPRTVVDSATTTTTTPAHAHAPNPAPQVKSQRQGRCPTTTSSSTSAIVERRSSSAIPRPSMLADEAKAKRRCSSTCASLAARPALRRFSSSGAGGNGGVSVGMVICEMLPSSSLGGSFVLPRHMAAKEISNSAAEGKVEAKSPPQERPTHVDMPAPTPLAVPNGTASSATGTVSGLPTPESDEDLVLNAVGDGDARFSESMKQVTCDAKESWRGMEADVQSGSTPGNGRNCGVGLNGGIGVGAVPVFDVSSVSVLETTSGAGVPDVTHLAYNFTSPAGTGADQQSVLYTTTHTIQLVHPTPVHVTATSPPTPSPESDPLSPPKLVVVNPTPNPTPHPTPPATPVLFTTTAGQVKGGKGVQYLALPAVANLRERERERDKEEREVLGAPLLRVPGPEGRRIVAMRVGVELLEEIPEGKEVVLPLVPQLQEREKSNSLSSASSGYSALSATTSATSVIEVQADNNTTNKNDNKNNDGINNAKASVSKKNAEQEQMVPLSSAHQADVRTPVPELPSQDQVKVPSPSPILPTPTPASAQAQFQAQLPLAESPVSQVSMSPVKGSAASPTPTSISGCSPSKQRPTSGLIRRASSGGSSSRSRSTGTGSSRPLSRSRSREGTGAAVAGLTMTTTRPAVVAAGKVTRTKSKVGMTKAAVRRGGSAIALARRPSEGEEKERGEKVREHAKPKFNIGSNSDDGSGMGSKSAGSGSDGSHPGVVGRVVGKGKGKEDAAVVERQVQLEKEERERESQMRGQVEREKLQEERMREQHLQQQQLKDFQRQQEQQRQAALQKGTANHKDLQRQLEAMIAFGQKNGAVKKADALASNSRLDLQPLLPQNKKKIVLATSESEFSEGEDWSSSELSGEDVEVRRGEKSGYQPPPPPPPQVEPQQHQHYPQRPPGPRRTQSSTGANGRKLTVQQRNHQLLLEQANREREMFTKRPSASYTNLQATQRSKSGLLTQLLNPDPRIFPPGYPHPRGFSSGEIASGYQRQEEEQRRQAQLLEQRRRQQFDPAAHQLELEKRLRMEQVERERKVMQQLPEKPPRKQPPPPRAVPLPAMAPKLGKSKSAAALPVMSGVQVGSVAASRAVSPRTNDFAPHGLLNGAGSSNSGYRPRNRPEGTEMEDDSETEDEGGMGISKSVAEEKLKALAERQVRKTSVTSASKPSQAPSRKYSKDLDEEVPVWARERPPPPQQAIVDRRAANDYFDPHQFPLRGHESQAAPSPIPLGHPYNLPPPEPPMTPRTTRRKMLQSELSESLRRNILWERKVSRVDLKRTTSSGGGPRNNLLNGIRPLTTTPSMVQLTAKGSNGNANANANADRARRKSAGIDHSDDEEREQARRAAITRNRSWAADDFHIRGW